MLAVPPGSPSRRSGSRGRVFADLSPQEAPTERVPSVPGDDPLTPALRGRASVRASAVLTLALDDSGCAD